MMNVLWMLMITGGVVAAAFLGTMGQLTQSMIDSASEAVDLCIFMLGVVGMWNGMMEIAIQSGLMKSLEKKMHPFLHWLFPDVPKGHPANEYIAANITANILGLGWAATPSGLMAMKHLKQLNEKRGNKEKASDAMCALLVLNISSLQLIPINMIAYRSQYGSAEPEAIIIPGILATLISTAVGILFIKIVYFFRRTKIKAGKKR